MNWTDAFVLIVIGGNMLYGWKKGFITSILGLVKWFASIILTKMFYIQFTNFALKWYDPTPKIFKHVKAFVINMLGLNTPKDVPMTTSEVQMGIDSLKLPEFYSKGLSIIEGSATYTSFVNDISSQLTEMIVYVLGFIVLLLGIMMVLGIFESVANIIAKLPIIKEFNKSGGLVIGAILGIVSVYFIMILLNVFVPFEWSQGIIASIESSKFAIYFYKYNILQYFFLSFLSNMYTNFLLK